MRIPKGKTQCAALILTLSLTALGFEYGQELTPADPYGLKSIGMPKRLEKRLIVVPSSAPVGFTDCGGGVFYTNAEVQVSKKQSRKIRIVVVIFSPDETSPFPDTSGYEKSGSPRPKPIIEPPDGYSALTFEWPAQLRVEQMLRLQRSVIKDGKSTVISVELPAEIDLEETNSAPSISWDLDRFVAGTRAPVFLGKAVIPGDPLLIHIYLAKGTQKCVEAR